MLLLLNQLNLFMRKKRDDPAMVEKSMNSLDETLAVADDQLLQMAASWQHDGYKLAIAFVIQTWGSSPRQIGSLMLVREDLTLAGSVPGG